MSEDNEFLYEDYTKESWRLEDVAALSKKLQQTEKALEKSKETIKSLADELSDLKTRRGWEEISLVTDDRTGRAVVVRTWYSWKVEGMRLDASNY